MVSTADRFSDDTPPEVPGRADNAEVHRGAASLEVHPRLFGGRVAQDHHTRAECLGAGELQLGILPSLGEQALPAADHEGVDPDPVLVDQVVFHQGLHERGTAVHLDVLARLLLQLGDLLSDITLDQGGVPVQRLGQRPGGDQLRDAVHPVEVWPTLDFGPGYRQQLVGDPPAEEIVAAHQVLVRILLSIIGEVRVAPTALLNLAETTWVLDNAIECDQGRHAELPHCELLTCAGRIFQQRRARHRPCSRPSARRMWRGHHASKLEQIWHQPDAKPAGRPGSYTGKMSATAPGGLSSLPAAGSQAPMTTRPRAMRWFHVRSIRAE